MWWPGLIKQGAVPFLAAGVMIAGVMTAIANKSAEPTATSTVSSSVGVEATSAMWLAAEKFARGPIDPDQITETLGHDRQWVETNAVPTIVGDQPGKLVITREFGSSEDWDADDIIENPEALLQSVVLGFRPFNEADGVWYWARFEPDGAVKTNGAQLPLAGWYAYAGGVQCVAPVWETASARG